MTKEELIRNIKDCGQSLIDNAEKIATEYKYRVGELIITCHADKIGECPYIEVKTQFVPENFVERYN